MKRKIFLPILALLLMLTLGTPILRTHASNDPISKTGFNLDTVIILTLYGTEDETILDDCFTLINEYEHMLSRTIEGSDIWNINHSEGKPVSVSEETAELIKLSLHYASISDGAFDITIAPYSILWDFQNNPGKVPSETAIKEAGSHVGIHNLHIDGATVTLDDPKAAIDLGGIAKGYIADRVKDLVIDRGVTSGLLNLGGNVLTIGSKPDGSSWKIGIRKPFGEVSELSTVVAIDDESVVTSGTYERYFEVDGQIYHHILDPYTGYPTDNGLESVTILSSSSADCDALSTTCFVLGLDNGLKLIESLDDTEAFFITADGKFHYTEGFPYEN